MRRFTHSLSVCVTWFSICVSFTLFNLSVLINACCGAVQPTVVGCFMRRMLSGS